MEKNRVIIVGGGIGGLAAALGLAKNSISSIVLEKSKKLGEIGAGIQLGPNAFHGFDYLGVGDQARKMSVYIDNLTLMDAINGEVISNISLGESFRKKFKNPYAVVHRGDLHGVLLQACKSSKFIKLQTNSMVIDYEQDENNVSAILHNHENVKGSALIGAEGLWSNIRQRLVGDGRPNVSGHTTYRSVIPTNDMPEDLRWNSATLWAGPKCHIVHYPLSDWKSFNLVVTYHNDAKEPIAGKSVTKDVVSKGFEHINPVPRQIIERGKNWKSWVLCDREPVLDWVDGKVALLGDAAHPMLQYLAQGACMAIEDAVCLSDEMSKGFDKVETALLNYQNRRRVRTARVQLQSREAGKHIYHPDGAHALLRNKILKSKSQVDWYNSIEWLYGSTGLDN
jgi:2-polyprenyl-6-methoxyphenol hydroxylase-like FAD-dependent oxidoreductase